MTNLPVNYGALLEDIKVKIQEGRIQAMQQVSRTLVLLYWNIGQLIVEHQARDGWGKSTVEQLSKDLKEAFPNQTGFSDRNLWDMRRFYETYKNSNLRQVVAEIPWGHHLLILQRTQSTEEKAYYLKASASMRWSRKVLLNQMKAKAYERHLVAPKHHNFYETLPEHLAEQAEEAIKSEYNLEFLGIQRPILERALEQKLLDHLQSFLLELGYGFSFIGSQYKLYLEGKEYRVDLLFFHRKLHCLIAIDLKIGAFEPEYAGKMNFYLEVLDEHVKLPEENPSIGIILCAEHNKLEVEYALRTSNKPMGVAKYQLSSDLPEDLTGQLPSPDELMAQLKNKLG